MSSPCPSKIIMHSIFWDGNIMHSNHWLLLNFQELWFLWSEMHGTWSGMVLWCFNGLRLKYTVEFTDRALEYWQLLKATQFLSVFVQDFILHTSIYLTFQIIFYQIISFLWTPIFTAIILIFSHLWSSLFLLSFHFLFSSRFFCWICNVLFGITYTCHWLRCRHDTAANISLVFVFASLMLPHYTSPVDIGLLGNLFTGYISL